MDEEKRKEYEAMEDKGFHNYIYWIATTVVALVIPQIAHDRIDLMVTLYGIAATLAILLWYVLGTFRERRRRTEEAQERQVVMIEEVRNGFKGLSTKVDVLTDAQQVTMRATLIHNAEKYLERGWITPEERAAWYDMHDKYSSLGANGLIDTYRQKLNGLPDKEIDAMME